jgi:hypothetical protein
MITFIVALFAIAIGLELLYRVLLVVEWFATTIQNWLDNR